MAVHRIHVEGRLEPGDFEVAGEEAHHAVRVKRLATGQKVELLNGTGAVGSGIVSAIDKPRGNWCLVVRVSHVEIEPPVSPRLDVCTALPKGSLLGDLIDGLSQVGAASWRPLDSERSVRESARPDKLQRIAVESGKQCGRAWTMEVGPAITLTDSLRAENVVMADGGGDRYEHRGESVRLLIGPEGGWTESELRLARDAGARLCRFGVHTMRIETAAVVAAGLIIEAGQSRSPRERRIG